MTRLAAVLVCLPLVLLQAEGSPTLLEEEYATGDWGGLRTAMAERGVVWNFTYAASPFAVATGGIQRGLLYNGLLDLGTDIDFELLFGWVGTHFHVNVIQPHGENGSANFVGDLATFSNIEAYDTWRLYECWLEQDWLGDGVSLRVGQITFDSEFAVLDAYGGLFLGSGFGAPTALAVNLPLPVYPNAAPGIRLRVEPSANVAVQAAVFDGNPAPALTPDRTPGAATSTEWNRRGTHWALRQDEGACFALEVSYRVNQVSEEELSPTRTTADTPEYNARRATLPRRGLAGSYEAGFVYATDRFGDIGDLTLADLGASFAPASPRDRGSNYAFYVNLEQELWREPGSDVEGLGAFAHAVWMPADRNLISFSMEAGLHYRGIFSGREDDALGLGVELVRVSHRVAAAIEETNRRDGSRQPVPDYEATVELVYRCQVAPWCSIQPHAQLIIQPGATDELGTALILGIRTNLAF